MRGWDSAHVTRSVEFGRADAPRRQARRQSGPPVSVRGPFAFPLARGRVDPAQCRRARGRHSHRLRSHRRLHIARSRILSGARSFTVIEGDDPHLRIPALHCVGLARLKFKVRHDPAPGSMGPNAVGKSRSIALSSTSFGVRRNFTNDEIRDDLDWVLARINAALRLPFD